MLCPRLFNLRAVERDGTGDRQLTFGDMSYMEPDVHTSGTVTASRLRFTDFGGRSIMIGRRTSWSPDSRYVYAAVAETDADIVLLDGLLR